MTGRDDGFNLAGIIQKGFTGLYPNYVMELGSSQFQAGYGCVDDDGVNQFLSHGSGFVIPRLNELVNLVATFNPSENNVSLYVNGLLERTTRFNITGFSPCNSGIAENGTANKGLRIGTGFNGTIDEVRIWNRSLTQIEVKNLYDATSEALCDRPQQADDGNITLKNNRYSLLKVDLSEMDNTLNWIASTDIQNDTILRNGTNANFGLLDVTINLTISNGTAGMGIWFNGTGICIGAC